MPPAGQEPGSGADSELLRGDLADLVCWGGGPAGHDVLVVVPSLSFDTELLSKVAGVAHYEERLLGALMALRAPRLHLVYTSSTDISPQVVDYYLGLIPGLASGDARARLTMISCDDASARPLAQKLLERPAALDRIRAAISGSSSFGLATNNTTNMERALAVELGIPLQGNPGQMDDLGTKSGSRETFRAAGVDLPDGFERLRDFQEAVAALVELKAHRPGLARAVVKLEEGFSGEGNAVFEYRDASPDEVAGRLVDQLRMTAAGETLESFGARFDSMGGIVEEYLADVGASPSGQAYITPDGQLRPVSTHDQVLGGRDGQVFLGSTFPADPRYRESVQANTLAVGEVLREQGARGRFAVDFVAAGDRLAAIEINLRKGGTTHPMLALALASRGRLAEDGTTFLAGDGRARCYYATDNVSSPTYRSMRPEQVIGTVAQAGLAYDHATDRGAILHLLGALGDSGKFGVTCIEGDLDAAVAQYQRVVAEVDLLAGASA